MLFCQREGRGGGSYISIPPTGMPIGNLTSQIFANIYLNELDRFVVHTLKPKSYLRYGDDFLIVDTHKDSVQEFRRQTVDFLRHQLYLTINPRHDILLPCTKGTRFLGVELFPRGRRLTARNNRRWQRRLTRQNASSYQGIVRTHGGQKAEHLFHWLLVDREY